METQNNKMKILLIGGTGIISTEVCRYAIKKGYAVDIVNRGRRKENLVKNVNLITADVKKEPPDDLRRKIGCINYDVVVDFVSYDKKQLNKTLDVINCRQFIFISTATVYSEQIKGHRYVESDDKNNSQWKYCVDKIECERLLEEKSKNKNFIYTIIRPYVTYDFSRIPCQIAPREYYTMIYRIRKNLPVILYNRGNKCTITASKDLAVAIVGLFGNPMALNEDFHITSSEETSWFDILNQLGEALKSKPDIIDVTEEQIKKYRNSEINVPEIIGDKSREMIFDNSKIKKAVPEFEGKIKFEECLDHMIQYYENKCHQKINYLWCGCLDRLIYKEFGKKINSRAYLFESLKDKCLYLTGRNSFIYQIFWTMKQAKKFMKGN